MDFDSITKFRAVLDENIFACMEMTKQPYTSILMMPINRFQNFLKWKNKLEDEKQKAMEDELSP